MKKQKEKQKEVTIKSANTLLEGRKLVLNAFKNEIFLLK